MLDPDVAVPSELRHQRFIATPLTTAVAVLDYESYMASPEVIRIHSDGRWPVKGFTLSDDLELVANHQADHVSRRAFAFALLAPGRTEALGCVYLNPLREYLRRVQADSQLIDAVPPASAMVTFWLRQDQQDTGLAEAVVEAVDDWLRNDWPLAMHLFRILPNERSSHMALERLGLRRIDLDLSDEERPYLWYQPT